MSNSDVFKSEIAHLVSRQQGLKTPCPYDGYSCCNICAGCGFKFCEHICEHGVEGSCERVAGHCPVLNGSGSCPKGWKKNEKEVV